MESLASKKAARYFDQYFDQVYLYFVRRVHTKLIASVLVESVFKQVVDFLKQNPDSDLELKDFLRASWILLSTELEKNYGQQKTHEKSSEKIHFFDDVYRLKDREANVPKIRGDQTFDRPAGLDLLYTNLLPMEREVLFLAAFEKISESDRAFILNMNESDATQLFLASLKKAKDLLDEAQNKSKSSPRFVSYFGNVLQLLQKAHEEEHFEKDTMLREALREKFSFSDAPIDVAPVPPVATETATDFEVERPPDLPPETSNLGRDFSDEAPPFSFGQFFQRFQAFFLLIIVVPVAFGLYFTLYSQDARVKHLLEDTRIQFTSDFSDDEKKNFARDVVLYVADRRDFTNLQVSKMDKYFSLIFFLKDGHEEGFIVSPFSNPPYQTKRFLRIASL
ncbi:MAG: hypothetical protein AAB551_02440 [Patescibacteria group bacterium]